jgi:hypothetical protein
MTFKAGIAANPAGRPKGTGFRHLLFQDNVMPHQKALFAKAIEMALEGNEVMLKMFLDRLLLAKPKEMPEDGAEDQIQSLLLKLIDKL